MTAVIVILPFVAIDLAGWLLRGRLIHPRPFRTRRHDRAINLWPLALLSFGES